MHLRSEKGYSIVELLVSLVILSIATLSFFAILVAYMKNTKISSDKQHLYMAINYDVQTALISEQYTPSQNDRFNVVLEDGIYRYQSTAFPDLVVEVKQ